MPTLTLWHVLRRVHTIQQSPRSEKPPNAQKLEVQVQHGEQCKFSTAQRIVVQFRVVAIFSHGADVNVVAKDFKDNKATDYAMMMTDVPTRIKGTKVTSGTFSRTHRW